MIQRFTYRLGSSLQLVGLLVCFGILLLPSLGHASTIPDPGEMREIEDLKIAPDPDGKITIQTVATEIATHGVPIGEVSSRPSPSIDHYWLGFKLENDQAEPRDVLLSFDRWEVVKVYSKIDDRVLPVQITGSNIPYGLRDFTYNSAICVMMQIKAGETREIYVHLSKARKVGLPPQDLTVVVSDFKTALKSLRLMGTLNIVLLFLMGFIIVYNIFFYIALKEKRYRFYLLGVFFIALELARWAGFGSYFFEDWAGTAEFEWNLLIIQNIGLICSWILMTRDFLNLKIYSKKLDRILLLWLIPGIFTLLFFRFDYYLGSIIAPFVGSLGGLYIAYVTWYSYRKGQELLGYLLFAIIVFSVFANMNLLHILGWSTDFQIISLPWRSLGSIVFDSVLSYALGRKYFGLAKDNAEKQARIIANLKEKNRLQSQLNRDTVIYQEKVQKNIANRIQTEVVPILKQVKLRLSLFSNGKEEIVMRSSELLAQTLEQLDHISEDLMPELLKDPGGLPKAIEQVLQSVGNVLEVRFHYTNPGELPEDIRILVYRIVKEVFTNALKHAKASSLEVKILHHDGDIVLEFHDDGIGFDPDQHIAGRGLEVMRQKLAVYEGEVEIDSIPGDGTKIRVELPVSLEHGRNV